MSKAKIVDKKSIESILGEKKILSELHHPFIVNMIYSFQDFDYLYLVMELLSGGNLRYHLTLKKRFNESQIKFLIGCIMIGLKYIHGQNILHRDIKPENLVFDSNGYLRITDFGIAKHYVVNNKKDTSGTIGYLAPEVLCNVNHNFSIDYYAVGIITYELMYGHRPYIGKNKHEVKQLILTRQAKIQNSDLPEGFSHDIADFINKLIQRKPKNRLGKSNINEVLTHSWFLEFDWDNCSKKKLRAPYIPKYGDNFDKNYCLQSNKIGTETMERYEKIMSKDEIQIIFKEFNCIRIPKELYGYNNKKINENKYSTNNNVSSNMSTTSLSRNNKNENKQNNLKAYNNMNYINRNNLKNKILNNDIDLIFMNNNNNINKTIFEMNQNKFIKNFNNININNNIIKANNSNKTYRNDYNNNINYLDLSSIKHKHNYNNISNIQKSSGNNEAENYNENIIYKKNNLINNNSIVNKKQQFNRNISARNINRNNSKILFNNATIDQSIINSGILRNKRKHEVREYGSKGDKYLNQSTKVSKSKRITNSFYNNDNSINYNKINKNIYLQNKRSTNISIPKSKKDFIRKEILRNQTLYYPIYNNQNNSNPNINHRKSNSVLMSSTIYAKKKNNSRRMISSNSMYNLNENNYLIKNEIHKAKNKLFENFNSSRSSKNILNYDKKLPFLNLSNKKIDMDNNEGNDIYFKFNKYKNTIKKDNTNDKTRNGLNYDFLTERIKNKKLGNN